MSDKHSNLDQCHKSSKEEASVEYGNIYFGGIRSALDQISKDFNIDREELEKSFSVGSSKSEAFSAEVEFLQNTIINNLNLLDE